MTQTIARIKQHGKNFEIIVDLEKALRFKKGQSNLVDFLEIEKVFTDSKKGFTASSKDLKDSFGTENINEIASKIVKTGEILLTKEYRDEEREKKIKQIIDFLSRNAIDPRTGNPHTAERIKTALEQAHINIKNTPIENQIKDIVTELEKVLPIKFETKKVRVTIPSIYTAKVYGLINQYKQNESWLENGDLEAVLSIPSGLIIDFYEKLNSVTHGSALTQEIKEEEK
ncbi:MAG: rRNA metabolism protein [Candidatus Pacearchaeota archaeon]|nr:MAG: rRNA metabolism protein [Candidatus Pacearchaeota archaeon]